VVDVVESKMWFYEDIYFLVVIMFVVAILSWEKL
jgi:hypothetical protein